MINQFENITYDSVKFIFNGEHHSIKNFLSLLNAIANDELDSPGNNLDDEIIYNYRMIRPLIEDFINETVYEKIYKSEMYDGLITSLIDIYSCLHTILYMRKHISDVDIQPKEVVHNYLLSFGFPALSEFNDYQKKEIARNVYGFLRRKGTPDLIKRILKQLGYPFFCISEFWLTKDGSGNYIVTPEIIDQFSNFQNTDTSWELLLRNKNFTLDEIRAIDPLWVISDEELNDQIENGVMTLPAKTAYFQFGVAASITDDERIVSSVLYAMAKKNLYEYSINEVVKDIRFPLYTNNKLSPLDLIYAFTLLSNNFSDVYDVFGLNSPEQSNIFDIEGKHKKFDKDMVFDTISSRSIYIASNPENNNYHGLIRRKCIGWNGDVTTLPIGEIIKEIRNLYVSTYKMVKYFPTRIRFNEKASIVDMTTPKTRFNEIDIINEKYFISNALFGDIDDTLRDFKKYNPNFYAFVENYIKKYEFGSEEYISKIYNFMYEIITILESYIYSKSGIQFNMRQQFITKGQFNSTTKIISNSFAPYHAKMIEAFYVHIIRELPYDQILMSDTSLKFNGMDINLSAKNYDPYWKRAYYKNGSLIDLRNLAKNFNTSFASINDIKFFRFNKGSYDPNDTINIDGQTYNPLYQYSLDYVDITKGYSDLYSGYKNKLAPHKITTKVKMRLVVDLENSKLYLNEGNDKLTNPFNIISKIPRSMWKPGKNVIEVEETSYDSYPDTPSLNRVLPTSGRSMDINSTDDPRWNDRVDTIKIQKFDDTLIDIESCIYIGSIPKVDMLIDIDPNTYVPSSNNN